MRPYGFARGALLRLLSALSVQRAAKPDAALPIAMMR